MSALQDLLVSLERLVRDAERHSADLLAQAQRLNVARDRAVAVARHSSRSEGGNAATALQSAHRAVTLAAQHLHQASVVGRGFIVRQSSRGETSGALPAGETAAPVAWPRGTASVADIFEWVGEINPGYSGDPFDPRSSNCGLCAAAVFARLQGTDPTAIAGTNTLSVDEMERITGRQQVATSPNDIRSLLVAAGPGAHAVIGIDRAIGPGHWFNAYFDGERVVAIDGQTGEILDWPPEYGSERNPVINWDMGELP